MECQVGKLEHFWRILLLSSIEGRKQRRRPETFAPCMATMPSQRARQGNGFLVLRRIFFYISVTPRSRRPSMFDEYRLNTLIHNDPHQCSRELANMMNCDHSTIVRHLRSMGKVQISGVWAPHAINQNHKKTAGGHMCISACSSSIGSWTIPTIPLLYRYWWREMVFLC